LSESEKPSSDSSPLILTTTLNLPKEKLQILWDLWDKGARADYGRFLAQAKEQGLSNEDLTAANWAALQVLASQVRICQVARIFGGEDGQQR
jgi:hypothetical protein